MLGVSGPSVSTVLEREKPFLVTDDGSRAGTAIGAGGDRLALVGAG